MLKTNRVIYVQPSHRRKLILDELNEKEKVDIEQLASELNVSPMTIRRDLSYLEQQEQVIRTHGGAVLKAPLVVESSFRLKEGQHSAEKRRIAELAVQYVQEHSTILLDSGTTTLEIAKRLKEKRHLTVITNDILIAAELMDSDNKVILTGGELQNSIGALFGPLTEGILRDVHVDLCFLGAHAVDVRVGVTAPTIEKAMVKKLMIEAAETTWLVADSSKFNLKSLMNVCRLSEIDGVISDEGLASRDVLALQEQLEVVTGGEDRA